MPTPDLVRVGVTGHIHLTKRSKHLVYDALLALLGTHVGATLRGITCLAEGTDQIFARAVLAARGSYEVILPARDYRRRCVTRAGAHDFDTLLHGAVTVSYASDDGSGEPAFVAANAELLRRCDQLIAVWDGEASPAASATAQVVARARDQGLPVTRVWPAGSRRRSVVR